MAKKINQKLTDDAILTLNDSHLNELLVFELRTVWAKANQEYGFDSDVFLEGVFEIRDQHATLAPLVNLYIYLLERFHFIDYYLTSTIEDTIQENTRILSRKGIETSEIQWFETMNIDVLFDRSQRPNISDSKLNPPQEIPTSTPILESSNTDWEKTPETVTSIGLIPLLVMPLFTYLTYQNFRSHISALIYILITMTYFLGIGINIYIVHDATSHYNHRPWFKIYMASLLIVITAIIGQIILLPSVLGSSWFNALQTRLDTQILDLVFYYGVYLFAIISGMLSLYYYWYDDLFDTRFKLFFAQIAIYVMGLISASFWLQTPWLKESLLVAFAMATIVQGLGSAIRQRQSSNALIFMVQTGMIIVTLTFIFLELI